MANEVMANKVKITVDVPKSSLSLKTVNEESNI